MGWFLGWFVRFEKGIWSATTEPVPPRCPPTSICKTRCLHGCVLLAVYVDDILVTGSDTKGITDIKAHLQTHFVTKDMDKPRYFLDIEFAYTNGKMALSHRKYVLDLLQETGLLMCKPESTPIEQTSAF